MGQNWRQNSSSLQPSGTFVRRREWNTSGDAATPRHGHDTENKGNAWKPHNHNFIWHWKESKRSTRSNLIENDWVFCGGGTNGNLFFKISFLFLSFFLSSPTGTPPRSPWSFSTPFGNCLKYSVCLRRSQTPSPIFYSSSATQPPTSLPNFFTPPFFFLFCLHPIILLSTVLPLFFTSFLSCCSLYPKMQ